MTAVALLLATAVPALSAAATPARPNALAMRPVRATSKPPKPASTPRLTPTPATTPTRVPTPAPTPTPRPTATATASATATPAPTATPTPASTPTPTSSAGSSAFPVRAAFYYPWFPEAWNQSGMNPFTHYQPSLGYYSEDATTVSRHIAAMQYGKIAVGIASWWGQGSRTDQRIPLLLSAAAGTGFQWALYYEAEGTGDPTVAQIQADLAYIDSHYGSDPSFYKVNGRPVIFVYAQAADGCGMANRWAQANSSKANYVVLKVFAGYATCASQPDQWHQYAPAVATDEQRGHSYSISPGFWLATDSTPRLARDLARWQLDVRNMVASGEPFQLVTTFNEWGEGTAVESATDWPTASGYGAYLDALHNDGLTAP